MDDTVVKISWFNPINEDVLLENLLSMLNKKLLGHLQHLNKVLMFHFAEFFYLLVI